MEDFPNTIVKQAVFVPLGNRSVTSTAGQVNDGKHCRKLRTVLEGDAGFDAAIAKTWVAIEGVDGEHVLLNDEIV